MKVLIFSQQLKSFVTKIQESYFQSSSSSIHFTKFLLILFIRLFHYYYNFQCLSVVEW